MNDSRAKIWNIPVKFFVLLGLKEMTAPLKRLGVVVPNVSGNL